MTNKRLQAFNIIPPSGRREAATSKSLPSRISDRNKRAWIWSPARRTPEGAVTTNVPRRAWRSIRLPSIFLVATADTFDGSQSLLKRASDTGREI
jgi:hypothetical protein